MRFTFVALIIVVVIGSALSLHVNRRKRWSVQTTVRVPVPVPQGEDLIHVLASAPDIRYTDWMKKLTALKASRHNACFITDLDPAFNLDNSEMAQIIHLSVPEKIDSPLAYNSFRQRAGTYITPMCQFMDVYWLTNPGPPVLLPVDQTHPGIDRGDAPPPLNLYHQLQQTSSAATQPSSPSFQQQHQQPSFYPGWPQTGQLDMTPPPHSDQVTNRDTPQTRRPILTPPPLPGTQHGQEATNQRDALPTRPIMLTPPPPALLPHLPHVASETVPVTRYFAITPPPMAIWRQLLMDKIKK